MMMMMMMIRPLIAIRSISDQAISAYDDDSTYCYCVAIYIRPQPSPTIPPEKSWVIAVID